jgi:hypothetical protein
LMELDPMSRPTICLLFFPPNSPIAASLLRSFLLRPLDYLRLPADWLIFRSIQRSRIVFLSFQRLPSLNAGISPSVM